MSKNLHEFLQKLTRDYAIDFDSARNWKKTVGRCLSNGRVTGRPPAIVLIMENPEDEKHLNDLKATIELFKLPIKVCPLREPEE